MILIKVSHRSAGLFAALSRSNLINNSWLKLFVRCKRTCGSSLTPLKSSFGSLVPDWKASASVKPCQAPCLCSGTHYCTRLRAQLMCKSMKINHPSSYELFFLYPEVLKPTSTLISRDCGLLKRANSHSVSASVQALHHVNGGLALYDLSRTF